MRKSILLGAAFSLVAATALHAAITAEDIVAQYQAAGYQRIEVKVGTTTARVEAIRDGMKIEVTYDLESGAVLKTESGAVRSGEDVSPGVEVSNGGDDEAEAEDGTDDHSGYDDDADDDAGDDAGDDHGSGHDGSDDDSGDDDGGDDDSGDDDGGHGRG
jgi:hypothetical protein